MYLLFVLYHNIIQLCDRINHLLPLSFVLLLSHALLFYTVSTLHFHAIVYIFFSYLSEKVKGENIQIFFFLYLLTYLPLLFNPSLRSEIQFVASSLSFDELPLTFLEMKIWWILFLFIWKCVYFTYILFWRMISLDIGFSVDVLFFLKALKCIILLFSGFQCLWEMTVFFVLLFSSMQSISLSLLDFKYFVLSLIFS